MTTVAYDGYQLVADRQTSLFRGEITKIFRLTNGSLYGACGNCENSIAVRDWLDKQTDKKPTVDDNFHAVVITSAGEIFSYEGGLIAIPQNHRKFFAIGSGRDFAMAAMMLGKNAWEAVKLAHELDSDTGSTLDTIVHDRFTVPAPK